MLKLLTTSLTLALLPPLAMAQIRLPQLPVVSKPLGAVESQVGSLETRTLDTLSEVRQLEIRALVRNNKGSIDTDAHGNPIVRGEILALPSSDQVLAGIAAAGFRTERESQEEDLGIHLLVLGAPNGTGTAKALKKLRALDPAGSYDFNHIYTKSGMIEGPTLAQVPTDTPAQPDVPTLRGARIGLIDSGVDLKHPALEHAHAHLSGCNGKPVAAEHGTAVASLMVGQDAVFSGVRPAAELYAVDVYCGAPTGGAVDALLEAFSSLARQRVAVINVSLVGPANIMLERAVSALTTRGYLIVAAVGNDGPAAPPLYPASYPRVVGVTGVDQHQHALIEAARGPQVMFAAPGADLAAAVAGGGYAAVRGTSFASPIVAALLASEVALPEPQIAQGALELLMRSAQHLGKPGRDLTYGYGLVGFQYRIDPATFSHR
jgi:hypothetical protein